MASARKVAHGRLVAVEIDGSSLASNRSYVAHERAAAIRDLIADNDFTPTGGEGKTFRLHLSIHDRKLVLDITDDAGGPVVRHLLSLSPLRRVVRDYFLICDSYYEAVRSATPTRIEAIDMGRRGLHDEGAEILRGRLSGKITLDFGTARRLFTLVCALHWQG